MSAMPKFATPVVVVVVLLEVPLRLLVLDGALSLIDLAILLVSEVQWTVRCIILIFFAYCTDSSS